jgi:DNA-binding NarL/FixJ family response regulator
MNAACHKKRIVLLDDHHMIRTGLRLLFESRSNLKVIGDGGLQEVSGETLPEPDVVVVNIGRACKDPSSIVKHVQQQWPGAGIVVLSDAVHSSLAAELFHAGVLGHVSLECDFDELLKAVRAAASGEKYMCCRTAEMLLHDCSQRGGDSEGPEGKSLTDRESTVLRMLADGHTAKQIGVALGLSSKTIDACRRQLMQKLDVDSVAGLVKHALFEDVATRLVM